ncbi:PilN domain-containing protein [Phycisphaerales bacterium AB-hyl4]|uniref:PilN domain-containing protein n=1 Tax=Natronomicrosphaera hydrolytica TaxID=3242702 RepID=A0ABV4TZS7_9BACT
MKAINLIPAWRREARRRRRYVRHWGLGVAMYAVLMVGAWAATQVMFGGPERAAAETLAELRDEATQTSKQIDALKPKLAEAQVTLAASRSVGSQPDWSLLLRLLAGELGDHVMLSTLRLEPVSRTGASLERGDEASNQNQYRLRMSGIGRDQAAVSAFVLRLERAGLFDNVTLIDTRREPFRESTAVGFRMECELSP